MAGPPYKYFRVSTPSEYVAHVEIQRPEKMNAFNEAMRLEIRAIFDSLSTAPEVRAVVFSGAGPRAFTTGLDVQAANQTGPLANGEVAAVDVARKATAVRRHIIDFQDCISSLEKCEKPVITAMHGYSYGLAIDLSVAADIRLCAADTKFSVKEVDLGLAADIGTLSRLPKVVGSISWCKEVCLTARIFGAEEAHRVGLVSGVYGSKEETVKKAIELAGSIAAKSPVAVQGTKDILNYSRDHTVSEGLLYTSLWNSAALQTSDVSTAMLAGTQKKVPKFSKL